MKTVLLMLSILVTITPSQSSNDPIEELVKAFAKAGDNQNGLMVSSLTHADFRIVWHDGQNAEVANISRSAYIKKLEAKEFGGDSRKVEILGVIKIDESNAAVQVKFSGEKAIMRSILSVANLDGDWKVLQELVTAEFIK